MGISATLSSLHPKLITRANQSILSPLFPFQTIKKLARDKRPSLLGLGMNDEEKIFEIFVDLERDSSAKSPTPRDFSSKDIEGQHLALALNLGPML